MLNYCIHSNKRPEHLDKSFWVDVYLFHYLLQGWTWKWCKDEPKNDDFGWFQAYP